MKKDGGTPSFRSVVARTILDRDDVRGLKTFRSLDQIELDLSSFRKRAEALRLDRGEMDEDVLSRFRGDETEALRIIEPLHFTGATHTSRFSFFFYPEPLASRYLSFQSCTEITRADRNMA